MWMLVIMTLQSPGSIATLETFTSRDDCVQAIVDMRPLNQTERQAFRLACVART